METNLTQLDRLQELLRSKETLVQVVRIDDEPVFFKGYVVIAEFHQIVVLSPDDTVLWDAICHPGSYGYEDGLLEVMGAPVTNNHVEGWLTADEIFARWQKWEAEHGKV